MCTPEHAVQASAALDEAVQRMRRGQRQRFLVGVGHGTCTCEGAAFEYIVNLEFELRARKVRDKAEIVWITNEYELGDFGMGGMHLRRGGYVMPSSLFTESLFAERGIDWITRAHVSKVDKDRVCYETLDGAQREQEFDFAMLLPPFSGVGLKAYGRDGDDITGRLFLPNDFMRVDADYTAKPYEQWGPGDWPRSYQSPAYPNIFAAGIAFAPPHAISLPHTSPNGTLIAPAPPRTGMPSAEIGKAVAASIADMIRGAPRPTRRLHGRDGRGVRGLRRRAPAHRHGSVDDRVPDRPGLRPLPAVRARPEPDLRRDRPRRALDQDPAAPHVPVQGQAPPRLGPYPGVTVMAVPDTPASTPQPAAAASGSAKVTAGTAPYVTRPTRWTLFTRTFIPWQLWRFARINLKMIRINRSTRRHERRGTSAILRGEEAAVATVRTSAGPDRNPRYRPGWRPHRWWSGSGGGSSARAS